ncbi:MAG: carboxypeptidase-like regulatory domain-containing protein [Planctomycetota bacterium]
MATTAGDGTFALPVRDLDAAAPLLVSLAVHAGGGGLLQRRVTIPAALAEFDIGDLVVGGPLAVRVVDEAGAAVAGAQVHALGEGGESASGRADAAGEVRLPAVPATARRLLVTATGFARAQQDLPPSGTATVRLVQANGLVVRVLAADGRPAPALALHVAADRLPFRAPGAGEAAAAPFAATLPLDAGGETRLDDLEPGVLLRLAAVDDLGQVLGAAEVVTPRTPTATTVVVTTTLRSFAFAGVVRDEAGRPVPRARVYVEADRFAQRARTDAQGRFEFGGLHGAIAGAHFEVTHPAFVPLVRSDLAIAADQEPMALVLERGRRLEVRVTQASGAPLPAGTVLAELAGNAGDLAEAVAPGTFVFANLAPRAGRVHVELGGREFEAKVQAHDTFVALAIPDLGTIDVHREAAGENGAGVCLVLTPPSGQPQRTYFRPDEEVLTLYLPPGDYRVQLERRWLGRRRVEPLGSPRDVVVRAGERQDLVLP